MKHLIANISKSRPRLGKQSSDIAPIIIILVIKVVLCFKSYSGCLYLLPGRLYRGRYSKEHKKCWEIQSWELLNYLFILNIEKRFNKEGKESTYQHLKACLVKTPMATHVLVLDDKNGYSWITNKIYFRWRPYLWCFKLSWRANWVENL